MIQSKDEFHEVHPASTRLQLFRHLRGLAEFRGWKRIVNRLLPQDVAGEFLIANRSGGNEIRFSGDVSSFVDRHMYLFGNYEASLIDAFLSVIPLDRRGTILDVGANVGTHSLSFAHHFDKVHSFEPNSELWSNFERSVGLNGFKHIVLHKVGLADRDEELMFHLIEKKNFGLGTFSKIEQYDLPLKEMGKATVKAGDDYLASHNIGPIDAIKIDVQGFEPEVLKGLAVTLKRDKPFVWFETGGGTLAKFDTVEAALQLFPYQVEMRRLSRRPNGIRSSFELVRVETGLLENGNYIAVPIKQ